MATNTSQGTITVLQTTNVPEFVPQNESWSMWKEKLDIHFCEIGVTENNQFKAILLKSIGATAYNTLHSLCSPTLPVNKTYKELCEILNDHFTPPIIVYKERKKFYEAIMMPTESVAQWFARTKSLALNCKFGSDLDKQVRDRFIVGLTEKLFERMCEEEEDLSINSAYKKAIIFEMKFANKCNSETEINFVKNKKNHQNKHTSYAENNNVGKGINKQKCKHCGWRNHPSQKCRYKTSKCNTCGKIGHLSSVCRSNKNVNFVSKIDEEQDNFDFNIYSISSTQEDSTMYLVSVKLNGITLRVGCDTGSACNLLPLRVFKQLNFGVSINPCNMTYIDYGGNNVKVVGEIEDIIEYENVKRKLKFVITDTTNPPLLGRSFLRAFNFELKQVFHITNYNELELAIKNEFSTVFSEELGEFQPYKVSLPISADVKPIFCKPRTVPLAWKKKIEEILNNLVEKGILVPVENAQWGTPIVPILKPNGELRLCGDFKVTLNKFLLNDKYPLPRIDEIFASLQGGEVFTKLDMSSAYNQLILDEEAQNLCTLSTHIGTFRMKRLPFGISPAASIFQRTMESLLSGIPSVVVYQDDITVTGKDINEHIANLKLVLTKFKNSGLTLNINKCKFFQNKIDFLGFTIDKSGIKKNFDRAKSILECPVPKDISELRAFIGIANYYSKFIENFSSKMLCFYKLLQKNTLFKWTSECQNAFENIKKEITSDQVLVHFNADLPIILTTDASNKSIAGILSHEFPNKDIKPVAFVSRSLSKAEQNYSTIEKEALAIIFCVTKLKQYLLGNKFILKTDHKPLISIFGDKKGIPVMAAARMQRWSLILSAFDYTIEHVKGQYNQADYLSRIGQTETMSNTNDYTYINYIQKTSPINLNFKNIAFETRRDPILSKICYAVKRGTLENIKDDDLQAFRCRSDQLTVDRDCLLWGHRIVVPKRLISAVLQSLHTAHLGIVKTKALARSYVWWPNINKDIENLVKGCLPCQKLLPSPEKSPLIPWVPENKIWSRVHIDFTGPINDTYLFVLIDSFSKWVEVFLTKTTTSNFVINRLREMFARFGLVDSIVSDNGRQFTSEEFKTFVNANGIKHILTAPGHPATNGQVEVFMKVLKKSILANLECNSSHDLNLALSRFLVDYRNTPHNTTKESPSKVFLGRHLKTRFDLLKPPAFIDEIVSSQEKSTTNYKGRRNVEFYEGQNVLIRDYSNPNKPVWSPGKIENRIGTRTYNCVFIHNNRPIKRHIDQIRGNTSTPIADEPHAVSTSVQEIKAEPSPSEISHQDGSTATNVHETNQCYKSKLRPRQK